MLRLEHPGEICILKMASTDVLTHIGTETMWEYFVECKVHLHYEVLVVYLRLG